MINSKMEMNININKPSMSVENSFTVSTLFDRTKKKLQWSDEAENSLNMSIKST